MRQLFQELKRRTLHVVGVPCVAATLVPLPTTRVPSLGLEMFPNRAAAAAGTRHG